MTGPTSKSERTRAAILSAAREHFAAHGYERSTVRSIAKAADIDPSMVIRYFGSKEALFAAASDFDLDLPELAALPLDRVGEALVGHFVDLWEDNEQLQVLLRSGVTNDGAATRMQQIFARQLVPVISPLSSPAEAPTRAGLAASQILGVALCRYVLRFAPVVAMTRDELLAWVGPTVQRYLAGAL